MIDEITIKNFQIHEKLTIKLKHGLNVIVGDTDTGKSAIIRALNLLLRNQPRNGETVFKNQHTNKAMDITIKSNGNVIRRHKRKYYLNNDKTPLKAFDKNVPLPIVEILPVNDINLQRQLDQHFLIFQTGGTAAKTLNASTGMEDQEFLMQMIKGDISNHKSNINRLLKNNAEYQETVKRLNSVTRLLVKANNVKSIQIAANEYETKIQYLENLINDIYSCQLDYEHYESIDPLLNDIENAEVYQIQSKQIGIKINALTELCTDLDDAQNLGNKVKIYNKLSQSIDLIENDLIQLNEIKNAIEKIHEAVKQIQELKQNRKEIENDLTILNDEFADKLMELGECPFCGTKFDKGECKC